MRTPGPLDPVQIRRRISRTASPSRSQVRHAAMPMRAIPATAAQPPPRTDHNAADSRANRQQQGSKTG